MALVNCQTSARGPNHSSRLAGVQDTNGAAYVTASLLNSVRTDGCLDASRVQGASAAVSPQVVMAVGQTLVLRVVVPEALAANQFPWKELISKRPDVLRRLSTCPGTDATFGPPERTSAFVALAAGSAVISGSPNGYYMRPGGGSLPAIWITVGVADHS